MGDSGLFFFDVDAEIKGLKAIYGDASVTTSNENESTILKVALGAEDRMNDVTFEFHLGCDDEDASFHHKAYYQGVRHEELTCLLHDAVRKCFRSSFGLSFFEVIESVRDIWLNSNITHGHEVQTTVALNDVELDSDNPISISPPTKTHVVHEENIYSSEVIIDRKSVFQAHVTPVKTRADVEAFMSYLLSLSKVAKATHNIMAFRLKIEDKEETESKKKGKKKKKKTSENNPLVVQDHDSDGERAAGGRLQHLLEILNVSNVAVVVSRWYGGVPLGPHRFRHINNCARQALLDGGFLAST